MTTGADAIVEELRRELESMLTDELVREIVRSGERSRLGELLSGLAI